MSRSRPFVCCPGCGEVMDLKRLGPVGVRGVKDRRLIKCGSCGKVFRTEGETWIASLGYVVTGYEYALDLGRPDGAGAVVVRYMISLKREI